MQEKKTTFANSDGAGFGKVRSYEKQDGAGRRPKEGGGGPNGLWARTEGGGSSFSFPLRRQAAPRCCRSRPTDRPTSCNFFASHLSWLFLFFRERARSSLLSLSLFGEPEMHSSLQCALSFDEEREAQRGRQGPTCKNFAHLALPAPLPWLRRRRRLPRRPAAPRTPVSPREFPLSRCCLWGRGQKEAEADSGGLGCVQKWEKRGRDVQK